jgi:serine/threonine protein kinase
VRGLAERIWFAVCLTFGRLLRSATYSRTQIDVRNGEPQVRKDRRFYASFLVAIGNPSVRILDTGVRVLAQDEWVERERLMYQALYGTSIRVDADGALILPYLPGKTLGTILEDSQLDESTRTRAIELAVVALAELHARDFTHGDAMADNVMIDSDAGIARWFDFETAHDPDRSAEWRRTDDVRALLTTCLARTAPEQFAETVALILASYANGEVTGRLGECLDPLRRSLVFHLGQAPMSLQTFREIRRLIFMAPTQPFVPSRRSR